MVKVVKALKYYQVNDQQAGKIRTKLEAKLVKLYNEIKCDIPKIN
jgi:hypothetical protein